MYAEGIPEDRYRRYAYPETRDEYFSADHFEPDNWAKLARESGMKWMCLTARHHDGYCLFESPHPSAFTCAQTHGRDLVREYVDACRANGLKVGLYYSPLSWRYPGCFDPYGTDCKSNPLGYNTDPSNKQNAILFKEENYANVKQLMSSYGQIDHIFWDGGWLGMQGSDRDAAFFHEPGRYMSPDNAWPVRDEFCEFEEGTDRKLGIMGMVRKLQPTAIVNARYGWIGDIEEEEQGGISKGPVRYQALWDKNITSAGLWGYDRAAIAEGNVMTPDEIVLHLINCVVRDMVLLLNVGPDRHGVIPPEVASSLRSAGAWIERAGTSIYGTRGGPWDPIEGHLGYCYRGDTLFVHLLKEFEGDSHTVPPLPGYEVLEAKELLSGRALTARFHRDGSICLAGFDRESSPVDTILEIRYDKEIQF
jgi:alpha-L-fucosidase